LFRIFPECKGGNAAPTIALYGENFTSESHVRFNMKPKDSTTVSSNLITLSLVSEDLQGTGSITVDVVNGTAVSNAMPMAIEKPRVQLNVFFLWYPWVTREIQLLLLVIFAGALGSYLHALMSVADFIGGRKLIASWFWWYISRPFLGMSMGLIFYAVLRGGFLAGSPADAKVVNPFGVLAIGALVGMFSDRAAKKLGEVFAIVFSAPEDRPDKLQGDVPLISKLEPATIIAGGTEPVTVKITGDRLGKVTKVRVNNVERTVDSKSETEVRFTLTVDDIAGAGQIEIKAVNADGNISEAATINVSAATPTDSTSPLIGSLEPATVVAGGTEPLDVKITGERLANVASVEANGVGRAPDSKSENALSFKLKPQEIAQAGQIEITAVNADNNKSAAAILTVTEPPPPEATEPGAKATEATATEATPEATTTDASVEGD
jgi:hypothetical protein